MTQGKAKAGAEITRILGIDPGSRATGYGVIDHQGHALTFVTCGVIRTSEKKPFPERLEEIYEGIREVIGAYQPQLAGIEDIFTAINPRSALKLGHARGVLILATRQHGLLLEEYSPRAVKQAVTGYGQAPKEQVQQMVRVLLKLAASPSHDAADALAVAICRANYKLKA
ncbi:MAG: crossover junction endodeoxyribonuclease RuvC [Deltaproteobacteria bacterium RIFOXYD12_FULL_56_24]|nr:MAG: crossover junction endodeoxyribonuclease RuvC [Deltaproteobacteria bacterium RIFOXYD12_FULL_56_24]